VSLSTISTGNSYACGLSNSRAYCWGVNNVGQIGTTTTEHCTGWGTCSTRMVPVDTDLEFAAISAGNRHVCGLTHSGAAYCWGKDEDGALGDGPDNSSGSSPVPVSGGHTFKALSAGLVHTCGITDAGEAYCWGANFYGQLGIGSRASAIHVPTRVAGELTFMGP
jgi:alpha-tubulin suppressor-like RCC1 family protein